MPQATSQELCAMLDAISVGSTDSLNRLIGRFAALRRVADLLFAAGLNIPLPNVSDLINAAVVDIDKYNQLSALCPGLIPPFNGRSLLDLQQTVNQAYLKLMLQIDTHPFAKLGHLQAQVDAMIADAAAEFSKRIGPGIQALNCARAICGATNQVGVYTGPVIQRAQDLYRTGIGMGGENANVLSIEQQAAVDRVAETRQSLINLLDTSTQQNVVGTAGAQTFEAEQPSELSAQVLLRGSQGNQGIQGSEGVQGFQGAKGNTGNQGFQGLQGYQGSQGAPSVVAGPQGSSGPQGIPGPLGNQGALGTQGFQGSQGSLGGNYQPYQFSTDTADEDPGLGLMAFNNADPSAVTQIYVSTTNGLNTDVTAWLAAINSYGSGALKGIFHLYSPSDPSKFIFYNVTLYSTATGYRKYSVVSVLTEGTFADADDIILDFIPAGPQGVSGAQGFQGVQGNQGFQGVQGNQGFQGFQGDTGVPGGSTSVWDYRASTSTAGNPIAGRIQWDNSTQISAANLYINSITNDGFDTANLLNSVVVGTVFGIQESDDGANFQTWQVSDTLVFVGDIWTVPVTLVASGGTGTSNFANNLAISVLTARKGPQGFQGFQGAAGPQGFQGFATLTATLLHDFGTVPAQTAQDLAVPLGGAETGDCAIVNRTDGFSWPTGAWVSANVVSNGTVAVNIQNLLSVSDLIPGPLDIRVTVIPTS